MSELQLPPGYYDDVRKLLFAAKSWLACRGADGLGLTLPPEGVMFIAPLSGDALRLLSSTELGHEFLGFLDACTQHKATAFMAATVLRGLSIPFEEWSPAQIQAMAGNSGAAS
jgi:hypothetical protein